jgi:putative transposase
VTLDFSRPGKPTDNPYIGSFNGSFREERLNVNWFLSLEDAKEKIRLFKEEYNGFRPHSSLSGLTPNEVVQQLSNGPIFPVFSPAVKLGGAQIRKARWLNVNKDAEEFKRSLS